MAFNKRKQKNNDASPTKMEERQPNHWAFDDDPLLNIEPVFSNSPESDEANKTFQEIALKNGHQQVIFEDKNNIQNSNKMNNTPQNKISKNENNNLANIINSAIKKSENIINELNDNNPIIAKLNKIEESKKTGIIDKSLYTDLSKSQGKSVYYRSKQDFYNQNATNNKVSKWLNETDLHRARRLQEKAQKMRSGEDYNDTNQEINNTMIQRRINNNKNAFAINIDKNQFYVKNNFSEHEELKKRASNAVQSLNPSNKLQSINNSKVINIFKNNDNQLNQGNISDNNINIKKFENEIEILEQELLKTLKSWQLKQVKKLNKIIGKKINAIQSKKFISEEDKIDYLKRKIKQLENSIVKNSSKGEKDGH